MSDETLKRISADLDERGMSVSGFITTDENGKIFVMSYNSKGLVKFISEEADHITINKRLGGCMIRPIAEIGNLNER